jgi:hypothetical protein
VEQKRSCAVFTRSLAHGRDAARALSRSTDPEAIASRSPTGKEQPVDPVGDQFRHSAHAGSDGGSFASHGLQRSQAKGLHLAGHEHQVGQGKQFADAVLLAEK